MWQLLLQLQPVIQQRAVPKAFLMARGLTARLRQCSLAHAVRLAVLGLALILSAGVAPAPARAARRGMKIDRRRFVQTIIAMPVIGGLLAVLSPLLRYLKLICFN